MAPVHDVAIVGAGLLGLAAARALAARDRDFVLLEQATVGHDGAGSKGSCRIFRLGYPDPFYVTAAMRARVLWDELEAQTGRTILYPTPHLTFGPQLAEVHDAMRQAGASCELLRQPGIDLSGELIIPGPALLETQSCVIDAEAARSALAAAAGLDRDRLRTGVRVTGVADDGRQVVLHTSTGQVTARTAVITAGPWTAGLLGPQLALPTEPTLEQVAYLAPRGDDPRRTPIFIYHGDPSPYGLPVPGSDRYKIGIHQSGPTIHPDRQDQDADPYLLTQLTHVAVRYLPGYQPEPVATERCVYDNSPDEDFIVDRVGNVVIGCGTSGHGFKFGPLFGEWLAALADGGQPPSGAPRPGGRFGLARFIADSAPETR